MKKLISSLFVAAVAAVSFGENLYRTQVDGGEWQYWETLADAVNNSISKSDTSIKTVVIELLKDDSTTWTTAILLGRNGSTGGYSDRTCRIRSSTEGGSTTRYTLKRAAAACFRASMPSFDRISVSFENIVIDGGAVWTDPDDPSSMVNTGVGAGQLFSNNGTYRATWTFGDGVTIRNVETASNSGVFCFPGVNSPITLNLLAGSRIENCRGAAVVLMDRQLMSLNIDGVVITGCGVTVDDTGLLHLRNSVQSASFAYGAKTLRNATITDNYIKSSAAVRFSGEFELDVSGLTTIADNVNAKGEAADLSIGAASTLKVDQALDGGSRIGIVSAAVPEIGAKFGEIGEELAIDGGAFFWDGNGEEARRFGRQNGADLVWQAGKPSVIEYEAKGYEGLASGTNNYISVKVTNLDGYEYEIKYSLEKEGEYTAEPIGISTVGTNEVWFAIESEGCQSVTNSEKIILHDPASYHYRTQVDGGEWTYRKTLSDVAGVISQQCCVARTSTINVELLNDDDDSFCKVIRLGYTKSGATSYQDRYVNFRSSTEGDGTARFRIRKAAVAAMFENACHGMNTYFTFSNIILDGGAAWADSDDFASTANTGVGAGAFFPLENGTYCTHVILSTNCVLRNFQTGNNGLIYASSVRAHSVTMEGNALVTDCRGGCFVFLGRGTPSLCLKSGTITRCGGGSSGLIHIEASSTTLSYPWGTRELSDFVITNNLVASGAAVTADVYSEYRISGATRVCANYLAGTDTPANVKVVKDPGLIVASSLTGGAETIGVAFGTGALGERFAVLADGVDETTFTGADVFAYDSDDATVARKGELSGRDLVWTEGTVRKISYEPSPDWDGYADGKTHAAAVRVLAPETAVVTYALDPAGPWSTELPDTTLPGAYTVHYRIEAPGCKTVSGSQQVVVYDESYVPEMKCRTRVDGGEWTYQPDFVTACSVVSQQNYFATAWTVDIELMCNQTMDGMVQLGFVKSGTSKHTSGRTVNIRTRSDNGQRYTLTRTTDSAKFYLTVHGEKTAYNFSNIVLDGGAEWTNEDDISDLTNEGVALSGNFFSCVGSSYSQWVALGEGAVMRNFDLSGGCLMAMTGVAYDKFRMESGSLVTDCRGGTFVDWQRHTGHLELVGGLLTRCSTGTKPNLFALSTSKATLTPGYPHGSHLVGGDFTMTSNAVGSAGYAFSCDMYCLFGVGERAVVRDNLRADGTAANVYAGGTSNLCLSAAFEKGADVGVRIAGVKPGKGVEFGLATGFEDDGNVTSLHPSAANGLFADEKPRYRGAIRNEKLVWMPPQSGLMLMVR